MNSVSYILSNIVGFNDIIISDNMTVQNLNKVECKLLNTSLTQNNFDINYTSDINTNDIISYKVIRYDKHLLSCDLNSTYGLCRSVIINSNNKVVGFAPPKSIQSDTFIKSYSLNDINIVAEEFIEGTMINVFWDESISKWEIATRNTVGANSSFYKGKYAKTFKTMFLEAAINNHLFSDNLEKENCYSFVLQHPENRIVVPFKQPQLYLVAVYKINNEVDNISVNVLDIQKYKDLFYVLNVTVKFPEIYILDKYADLIQKYASMNTSYNIVGVVLYNKLTGERAKIRNPVYEQVRNLRGNQPKIQYQYLCLRKEGKVGEYLKFYSENKKDFSTFRDQVHLFTNTLFTNYKSCYIKKEKPLLEFSEQYRTHMFNIHQTYLNELREQKLFITNTVVIKYVNEMHPSLLMYCLNFQMRKRIIDTICAEHNI